MVGLAQVSMPLAMLELMSSAIKRPCPQRLLRAMRRWREKLAIEKKHRAAQLTGPQGGAGLSQDSHSGAETEEVKGVPPIGLRSGEDPIDGDRR